MMHKCIVCSNSSQKTRRLRPDVIYHSFPKNEFRRRKWLNVFGIAQCYDWHRVCSDHFLIEDYKPGGKRLLWPNTVPQPYNPNYDDINYSNNTLNDDGQISNNECLQMHQNLVIDEQIEETVVNNFDNFESPRRSCRKIKLTTTNEDMSYENMPRLQTARYERKVPTYLPNNTANENNQSVQVPILSAPKDHSLGSGIRCSVKNCRNRYSKYLSFFGYPSDFSMRKLWIENCGLEGVDPTKKLKNSLRVCRQHFADDCFMNSEKRNRLKYDAVPTLFLDNDTSLIDERNIPSTSSSGNNGFIYVDNPSCLSSNYSTNEETSQPPNRFLIDSVACFTSNASRLECCVPGCMTNSDEDSTNTNDIYISLFKPPYESVGDWSSILGLRLTENSVVCGNHFRPQDILSSRMTVGTRPEVIKTLAANALPLPFNVNGMQSTTTNKPLKINALPMRTYEGRKKRFRANNNKEHLSTKKIRNNLINKSNTTTRTIYISENKDNVYMSATNDTHTYASTRDLNPTFESNIVKTINLPKNTDNFSTPNTSKSSSFTEVLPKILANSSLSLRLQSSDEQNTSKQISAIDNTKEVVTSYVNQPILKKILTENVANAYMYQTTSDNSSIIDSSSGKTCPINVIDKSLTISVQPVKPAVDLSIIKIEPNDTPDSLQTNFEQITETHNSVHNNLQSNLIQYEQNWDIASKQDIVNPAFNAVPIAELKIKPESVDNDDDLPLLPTSIDDSSSIEISNLNQKLKKMTANSSLSITLETFENTKVTEPSVDLFSKTSAKSSMSITLQPKPNHNLSLTTNNNYPSVTFIPNTPSTSNAMYNISQHNSTQYEQESASTLNMQNQLSSYNLIYPKFINNQMINPNSPTVNPNLLELSESHEIRSPVIDRCYSLESMPNDFNSNNNANNSECIIDANNAQDDSKVEEKDNGFIYEISKTVILPSVFWMSLHDSKQNSTVFIQRDDFNIAVKKINFPNSLVPTIIMYGKKYHHNIPIKTKMELETLLEKIDNFEKCSGNDGIVHEKCIGYFDAQSEDIEMCFVCQNMIKDQDVCNTKTIIDYKSKTIASLQNKISERKLRVNEARKKLQKIKKKEINRVLHFRSI